MTVPILLTPTEAAAALGIGRSKLYELMHDGIVESIHIGTCRRIPAQALEDLVATLRGRRIDRPESHPARP
ncbi:MAG: helix-turn-helix domain-containing protein [Sporichthyaceae bacterium]